MKGIIEMTLQELYQNIGGSYEQAVRVLRIEKLIDKHIRKFTKNQIVEKLLDAGKRRDPEEMFECAHAMKGVCANLGLTGLSELASELADEYREGNERRLSDEEISGRLDIIEQKYRKTAGEILRYEENGG